MSDTSVSAEIVVLEASPEEVFIVTVAERGADGASDHGLLDGLADDDHLQYHNDARGDARYTAIAHASDTANPHAVTAAQVNADPVGTAAGLVAAHESTLDPHDAYVLEADLGTAAYLDAGTAVGDLVQVQTGGKLPALDGSDLINLPGGGGGDLTQAAADMLYAPIAKGVTNGDAHDHIGGDGTQITYASLSGLPTLGTASAAATGDFEAAGAVAAHAGGTGVHAVASVTGLQGALDAKAPTASPTFTGTVVGITAAMVNAPSGSGTSTGTNTGDSSTPAETTTTIGALLNGATSKTTPVDADHIGLMDSASANIWKKLSWANLKTALSSIFVLLAGKSGGQTIIGGTAASENLTLQSTSHATKGKILLGSSGVSAYDSSNDRLGIGTSIPAAPLHSIGTTEQLRIGYDQSNYLKFTVDAISSAYISTPATGSAITISNSGTVSVKNYLTAGFIGSSQQPITTQAGLYSAPATSGTNQGTGTAIRCQSLSGNVVLDGGVNGATGCWIQVSNKSDLSANYPLLLNPNGGNVAVGGSTASARLHITSTTEQLRCGYDAANYLRVTVNSLGATVIGTASVGTVLSLSSGGRVGIGCENLISDAVLEAIGGWSFVGAQLQTNAVDKSCRIGARHYLNAEEPVTILYSYSNAGSNILNFGGGTSIGNAATDIRFSVAANNTTTTGAECARFSSSGNFSIGTANTPARLNVTSTTEQFRSGYDASNYLGSTTNSAGVTTFNLVGTAPAAKWAVSDATTNAIYDVATFSKNSTGAGAAGLGARIVLAAKSSTTVDTPQASISSEWVNATHATRTSRLKLSANDYGGARDGIIIESDGAVPRLGFYGATAVVKPTALTATVSAAPAGGTGTADGGWDTSINRDLAIATINNLKTRVDQLETKLQALGLLT